MSPVLAATGRILNQTNNKAFGDHSNDGLYLHHECKYSLVDQDRNLATFECDLVNSIGLGNLPNKETLNFIKEFFINREDQY